MTTYQTKFDIFELSQTTVTISVTLKSWLNKGLSKHKKNGCNPSDKSDKHACGFLGPPWCNSKIDLAPLLLIFL